MAYHLPPIQGSSGVLRSLSFARKLLERGWEVTVLVPAARMGAAHWGLRGVAASLQAWWAGPSESIQFGAPQVP